MALEERVDEGGEGKAREMRELRVAFLSHYWCIAHVGAWLFKRLSNTLSNAVSFVEYLSLKSLCSVESNVLPKLNIARNFQGRIQEFALGAVPPPLLPLRSKGCGKRCKLPQWGPGQRPGRKRIWCSPKLRKTLVAIIFSILMFMFYSTTIKN